MASWIESVVANFGIFGIAALMFLENVFPPIPSELIMPLAGYAAAQGHAGLGAVIIAGAFGSLAGATFWYALGRAFGEERVKRFADRHGRWLTTSRADVERADRWFARYGHLAVLFGRLVPTVRTLISIPAGLAAMPLGRFLGYSAVGTAIWTAFLALLGYGLGSNYEAVADWIDPISLGIVVLIAAAYVWRVATYRPPPA